MVLCKCPQFFIREDFLLIPCKVTAECPPPLSLSLSFSLSLSLSLVLSFRLCLSLFLITALSQPMIAISESACDDSIVVMVRRTKPSRAHSKEKGRDLSIYFLLFELKERKRETSFSQTAREYTNKIIINNNNNTR